MIELTFEQTFPSANHCKAERTFFGDYTPWLCTMQTEHPGVIHVAQGSSGVVYAIWDDE